jgi:hypothetical protein
MSFDMQCPSWFPFPLLVGCSGIHYKYHLRTDRNSTRIRPGRPGEQKGCNNNAFLFVLEFRTSRQIPSDIILLQFPSDKRSNSSIYVYVSDLSRST